jgi:hypothetical protein
MLYIHFAVINVATAHIHTRTAIEKVTKRVGIRTSIAMPIQKREKMMAAPRAKATVKTAKVANMAIGRKEKMSCETRNDYDIGLARYGLVGLVWERHTNRSGFAAAKPDVCSYAFWRVSGLTMRSTYRWA